MFPIIDVRGNVIGFGGRVMDDSTPKYLNSPETIIFNKRRNLFAMNVVKKSKREFIILTEGYMDAIALHQYGFDCAVASLGTSLNELARTLPQYRNYLYEPMQTVAPCLQRFGFTVSVVELNKYIDPNAVMTLVTGLLTQLSNAMSSIFLLLLTVVFMLLEVPQLPAKLQQLMSRPVEGMGAIQRALDSVSHYLVLKTAISLVTGLVVWGMLVLLDVRFAFMWGLLAFALNYIPNIGSVLAAIPPILQVLVFGGLYEALVVLAGYLAINLVFGNILEPRIMGRGLGLSTLVVFLSLIFWGWLLGPVGMLLSVPLTIIVKIALEQTVAGQSIAFLLSDLSKN